MHLTMRFDFHTEICRRSLIATSVQVDVSEGPHHMDREGGPICGSFFSMWSQQSFPPIRQKMACWLATESNLMLAPVLFTCESNIVLKRNDVYQLNVSVETTKTARFLWPNWQLQKGKCFPWYMKMTTKLAMMSQVFFLCQSESFPKKESAWPLFPSSARCHGAFDCWVGRRKARCALAGEAHVVNIGGMAKNTIRTSFI